MDRELYRWFVKYSINKLSNCIPLVAIKKPIVFHEDFSHIMRLNYQN